MNEQFKIEVEGATQQWVASFMAQYNVPASIMEDALTKVLCAVKDQVFYDFIAQLNNQTPAQAGEETPVE